MKNIVIFSGTTEGRLLAESFAIAGVPVTVCVATEYGEEVMEPDPLITVRTGRMDSRGMASFLSEKGTDLVFDATHPYALIVSANIRKACEAAGVTYRRIERATPHESHNAHQVIHTADTAEAVKTLELLEGKILLTTGSKELKDFKSLVDRLYVRVLPSAEAIGICDDCGLEKSHIIAQQGPFTYEENLALIRRYDIGVLVTKNSGKNGGYEEKIRAAETAHIPVIVIDRPVSVKPQTGEGQYHIFIIGAGCGEETLTLEASQAIRRADLIIGTTRLLDYGIVKRNSCPKYNAYKPSEITDIIKREKKTRVAVLFSGDSGFYSGAAGFLKALPSDTDVKVYPGISSVSALSARTGISYSNAAIKSYHGVEIDEDELRQTVADNKVTFILLSGKEDVSKIISLFPDKRIIIGSDLGTDHEHVGEKGDASLFHLLKGSLYTAIILDEKGTRPLFHPEGV